MTHSQWHEVADFGALDENQELLYLDHELRLLGFAPRRFQYSSDALALLTSLYDLLQTIIPGESNLMLENLAVDELETATNILFVAALVDAVHLQQLLDWFADDKVDVDLPAWIGISHASDSLIRSSQQLRGLRLEQTTSVLRIDTDGDNAIAFNLYRIVAPHDEVTSLPRIPKDLSSDTERLDRRAQWFQRQSGSRQEPPADD